MVGEEIGRGRFGAVVVGLLCLGAGPPVPVAGDVTLE